MVSRGDTIGIYRVVSSLGKGGMGEVWMAEHVRLGRRVAIKLLRSEVSKRRDIVDRFFDEARAAAQVVDPGIVQVHDFGRHEDAAYIVMEHLVGEALSTRLAHIHHLPPAVAARLVQQAAMTMAVAHGRGIVHRDLKPDNIFLVADPAVQGGERVKILDFGIAKLLVDHGAATRTQTGAILGTPLYMSPEQCRDAATVDHRTDIYALGCVLYHVLCGRPPFIGESAGDLIAAHLVDPPTPPSTHAAIAPELDALVLRCLAKSPDDRFDSMTELARALAPIAGTVIDIPTIAPMRRNSNRAAVVVAIEPDAIGSHTTLGTGVGETRPTVPSRSRFRRLIALAGGLAAVFVAVVVTTRTSSEPMGLGPITIPTTPIAEPAIVPIDAAVAEISADARQPPPMAPKPRPHKPTPPKRPLVDDLYDSRGD